MKNDVLGDCVEFWLFFKDVAEKMKKLGINIDIDKNTFTLRASSSS